VASSSGTYPLVFDPTSLAVRRPLADALWANPEGHRKHHGSPRQGAGSQVQAKETRNQTFQRCAFPKADRERDGSAEGDRGRRRGKKSPTCISLMPMISP